MADLFTRSGGETPFNVKTGLVFGTTPCVTEKDGEQSRIVVEKTGRVRVELKGLAASGGGTLFQSVALDQRDMMPVVTSLIPGPCVIDLTAVEDRVRAALKLGPDDPVLLETVRIDAASPKDKLTVNGVEVDLDPPQDFDPDW